MQQRPAQTRAETDVPIKALKALYFKIGDEEKKRRENTSGARSDILKIVLAGSRVKGEADSIAKRAAKHR